MIARATRWKLAGTVLGMWLIAFMWTVFGPDTEACNAQLGFCQNSLQSCVRKLTPSNPFGDTSAPKDTLYIITPTYARYVQKAELTRLSHTFALVKSVHWIVVEDAERKSALVANLLKKSGIKYTHLHTATPQEMKVNRARGDKPWSKPRGVLQRNEGLRWLRSQNPLGGIIYFADDDNTYDLELFDEMASIRNVGVWPVAFVGELLVEKPIVENDKVVAWDVAYKPERPFAMDMAGFAFRIHLLIAHPDAKFDIHAPTGYQESYFLQFLGVKLTDLEPKANNCTNVLVWHTRTEAVNTVQEKKWNLQGKFSFKGVDEI